MATITEKSTILVVDDNITNLNILLDYLNELSYKVLIAANGEQALQQLQHIHPDVILLDVMMPGIDGFETCLRLKANKETQDIPVIFMTALTDTVDKIRGFTVGGVDYITKPFQHEEVLARLKAHLTIRKLQQELQQKNDDLEQYADILAKKNTELATKNAELDEKNVQLNALNADKDLFFSIIAHDLRNPISALRELPQIIIENLESYSQDDLRRMISMQRDAAKNLFELLENLLTWSRIQRGMIEHEPQPINLKEIVDRNIALLAANAYSKKISVKNDITFPAIIYVDYKMMDTVLRNLLSNAIKFTGEDGNIEFTAIEQDQFIQVAIRDTGMGIGENYVPKLFRIDEQYRRTGTANERGTGLGLILCKEFVERNGGRIWVESEVGKGSTFRFTSPKFSKERAML
ncbi:response regulator receiver sensor signal transduction histidine kinase [Candidatus Moduliflexus flocculans]|uniref:histidine kinase n=1 Tax=Candidatus Moduliflexus flocculans TaxID=1499966 RepID=A0A0S6W5U1_9BACT|nr:response regulator receiver sensor signal transduction histidine kinase [Candidatus Moduliflexus flocculans]